MVGTLEGYWLPHNLVNRGQMAKIISLILKRLANRPGKPRQKFTARSFVRSKSELTIETKYGTYIPRQMTAIVYVDGKALT